MMGDVFPEIARRQDAVIEIIREEEESFGQTLDRGIDLFEREADRLTEAGGKELPGAVAFDLYATYGFPVDLTQIMADERGMTVDMAGFEQAMAEHADISRAGGDRFKAGAVIGLPETDDSAKFDPQPVEAKVLGWVAGEQFVTEGALSVGEEAALVLDRTNCYGEQGGQVGDRGRIAWDGGEFEITDTQVAGSCVLHPGKVISGELAVAAAVTCQVAPGRMDTMRNHTATHLLNWALRQVLGDHVNQAGSEVGPNRLRFDFSHNRAPAAEELAEAEKLVNQRILADEAVEARTVPLAEAQKIPGVRAMFGEKYPDPVRVVSIGAGTDLDASGQVSAEFCGGTHLARTSQISLLKILHEESVAKGVRRITAITGRAAMETVGEMDRSLKAIGHLLRARVEELPDRVASLQKEVKKLRKRPAGSAGGADLAVVAKIDTPQGPVQVARLEHTDVGVMRNLCDQHRQKGSAALFVGGASDGKVMLVAMVSEALVAEGAVKAGDWVKAIAPLVGGGGGGKPTMAQAGGKQPGKLGEALESAARWVREKLA